MKLKLACADFSFPLLPHEQSLDVISMLGFDGVDIGLFENRGHLQPSAELKNPALSAAKLAKKLKDRGLRLADMYLIPATNFNDLAPNHPDARVRRQAREQFRRLVDYTVHAGGRHVSGLPGVFWPREMQIVSQGRSLDELAWRAAHARDHGLIYSVEPHIGSIIPSPATAADLVETVPGLTLTLDYGHFTCGGVPDRAIEPLIRHASHFHCRGGRKDRLQASFKDNAIDFARVLRVMNRTGYAGYVGVEYVWVDWQHCNEVDNLSETIHFRDFLRNVKLG